MYFSRCAIFNSGPIGKLNLIAPFDQNNLPKPLILVGTNGSGKTGLLSVIADSLAEIAAQHFSDVLPQRGTGHVFLRVLGGRSMRSGQPFEFSAVRFFEKDKEFYVRAKAGNISPSILAADLSEYAPVKDFSESGNEKIVHGDTDAVEGIFKSGAYAFFPSTRYEIPHWATLPALDRNPDYDFSSRYSDRLDKPFIVQSAIQSLKSWVVNVLFERSVDIAQVIQAPNLDALKLQLAVSHASFLQNYNDLNSIISNILGEDARFVRIHNVSQDRKIAIAKGNQIIIPSLDHLSAGQATLLSIFGTIARYGGAPSVALDSIQGIAIIDEIDSHLHANLQHEVLPALIKLFPRVQFIISSHAPLFVLGMRKVFGDSGFMIVEMPSGLTIDAERFSEFESSFAYVQATKTFEAAMQSTIAQGQRPLVLCEGETDPKYLRSAAEIFDMSDLASQVDFDWIGEPSIQGAHGGGKSHLNDALKFLKYNPQFQTRKIVLLYDPETSKPEEDFGNVHVRTIGKIASARRQSGIENLLSDSVFDKRFFEDRMMGKGDDKGPVPVLKKSELCEFLCEKKRQAADFENFRPILGRLQSLLCPPDKV